MADFKTVAVKAQYLDKYGAQLHAYTYAVEHPARSGRPMIKRLMPKKCALLDGVVDIAQQMGS